MTLKDGRNLIIRELDGTDTNSVLTYMKKVNVETSNLLREPDEFTMTLEQERTFLNEQKESPHRYMIGGFVNGELVSVAGFYGSHLRRIQHRVTVGMSVLKAYHRLGIGYLMMNVLIKTAKEFDKTKIELDVRSDNQGAIALYKKIGFIVEGTISKGMFVNNKYVSLLNMALDLEEKDV
jgi:RimJ/RimL family protein N-acetyltransferase